jgi:hypothetical protein
MIKPKFFVDIHLATNTIRLASSILYCYIYARQLRTLTGSVIPSLFVLHHLLSIDVLLAYHVSGCVRVLSLFSNPHKVPFSLIVHKSSPTVLAIV